MIYINSVSVLSDSVVEPVSRTDVKNWLRIDYTSDDSLIDSLINAARVHIEKLTGRSLVNKKLRANIELSGYVPNVWMIDLPYSPLICVDEVKLKEGINDYETLTVNDVVEIFAYTAFTVANAYTKSETDGLVGSAAGLKLLTPTSVAVGSGSGSVGTSGTVTFSGASSVSLNGVFSATYKSYKVVYKGTQSAQDTFALRVRANGTDLTSSVYKSMVMWNTSASGTFSSQGSDGATSIDILGGGVQSGYYIFDINDIFEAKRTAILERAQMMINSSNTSYNITGAAQVYNTTSYDGLTFIPGSGTITGTISVYGYKD